MQIVIGSLPLGKTDVFDYECIKTEFFCVGLPLFPVAPVSFYITPSERRSAFLADSDRNAAAVSVWAATRIPLHAKSVRAVYARWWGLGVVLLAAAFEPPWSGIWLLVTGIVWIALFIESSITSDRAKKERRAFALATGVGAWPEIQYHGTAQRVFDELERTWRSRHETSDQCDWRTVAPVHLNAEDVCAFYALCRYARVLDGDGWDEKIEAAWKRLGAMEFAEPQVRAAVVSKPLLIVVLLLVLAPVLLLFFLAPAKQKPGMDLSGTPTRAPTNAKLISDTTWRYHSPEHGFSLTLPSERWSRSTPSSHVVQFTTDVPLPMLAVILSVEKQTSEAYMVSLPVFKTELENQKGIIGKPIFQNLTMGSDNFYLLARYRKEGPTVGQVVYLAISRSWISNTGITVTVLVEGQGTEQSTRQGSPEYPELKRAAESICLSIK